MSDEKQYEITYFKASGKYYTTDTVQWPKDAPDHSGWNPLSTFHRIKEMYAVCMDAPHGFPQFSPPKTVYDLQQTIYELNCRVAELKRELVEKDVAEVLGFAEGFEEATEKSEKAVKDAIDGCVIADELLGKHSSGRNASSAPRVTPGENLPLTDPRFGTPEHMQARWQNAGIRGPFFIDSVPYAYGEGPEPAQRYYIRECNGRKCVAECNGRPIADAVLDALDAYEGGKKL